MGSGAKSCMRMGTRSLINFLVYTVCKMGLILRSIEWMLKMQFSMARTFTLQPLRRYDVKPPEKTAQA